MDSYRYLIVGGGMAADAVCKGIRSVDETGTIGVVGAEPYAPYKRPPLTKDLWTGGDEEKIWRKTPRRARNSTWGAASSRSTRCQARPRRRGRRIRVREARACDGRHAAGGSAATTAAVIYFRDLDDYRRSRALSDEGATLCGDRRRFHRLRDGGGTQHRRAATSRSSCPSRGSAGVTSRPSCRPT